MDVCSNVAAFIQIKNEDYWIELILRTVCKVFSEVLVMDNGSTDKTLPILDSLRREGLSFRLVCYDEPWCDASGCLTASSHANSAKNAAIRANIKSRWVYIIDGDEIQYQTSCEQIASSVLTGHDWVRGLVHFQFNHPTNFLWVTRLYSEHVRSRGGRIFDLKRTRWKEPGYDEFEFLPDLGEFAHDIYAEKLGMFLPSAVVLHTALHQRSSLAAWNGANDYNFRKNYATRIDAEYEHLRYFPKESIECRYSDHNGLLQQVRMANGIEYV